MLPIGSYASSRHRKFFQQLATLIPDRSGQIEIALRCELTNCGPDVVERDFGENDHADLCDAHPAYGHFVPVGSFVLMSKRNLFRDAFAVVVRPEEFFFVH